jgi:hypothetical protein
MTERAALIHNEAVERELRLVANAQCIDRMADTSDDAIIYAGSATWDMWQCHLPMAIQCLWKDLSQESRLVAFLIANAITHFNCHPPEAKQ